MAVILASGSPRRKEILSRLGVEFEVMVTEVDEGFDASLSPDEAVRCISERKAEAVKGRAVDIIVAADTMVSINGKMLGKPKDKAEAFDMLSMLSGKTHSVFTGVTIIKDGKSDSFTAETKVQFYELSEKEIWDYIETGEPMDKAGAYGIQGLGALLVKRISGDYLNAVGLPGAETVRRIKGI